MTRAKRAGSGEKAETWLRKGTSRDDLRGGDSGEHDFGVENLGMVREGEERGPLETKTANMWGHDGNVGAWDMVGGRLRANRLEGAGGGQGGGALVGDVAGR